MFAVFQRRNYALLWIGQVVSMLGDWVVLVALPFYMYQSTGSALATSALFAMEILPRLFLGSLAGVFVDRWDRRKTMIAADLSRALVLLPLLLIHSRSLLWLVYVVAFIEAVISQFFSPAQGALIPRLVDEQQLVAANALNSLGEELTRLVGPTLGGGLFALFGLHSVIFADSFSFVFSGLMILLMTLPSSAPKLQPEVTGQSEISLMHVWQEWMAGFRLMRKERVVAVLFVVAGTAMIGEGIGRALLVPFLSKVANGNALLFSWILTAQGIGGIIGSLFLQRVSKALGSFLLVALGGMATGLPFLIQVTFPVLPVVLIVTAGTGAPVVFFYTSVYTLLQRLVPNSYQGRIFGAYFNTNTLLLLIGMSTSGLLGDRLGVRPMLYLSGIFYFLAGLLAFMLLRRAQLPEEEHHQTAMEAGEC